MTVISIVAEGVTDQVYIEEMLYALCSFEAEPEFIYAQPVQDATDQSKNTFGGWENVMQYCANDLVSLTETSDFVIIQIDTDCADHKNYDVARYDHGNRRSDREVQLDTISRLCRDIDNKDLSSFGNKLIFAVSIDSLETWVANCSYGQDKQLNAERWLKHHITDGGYCKTVKYYKFMSRSIRHSNIAKLPEDHSLKLFLKDFCDTVPGTSM